ncbi:aminotransferase class I/II-fold pyridoxal phosphate-dependent enzyme [Palleronia caenipelagi]|uniref:Aminotransferase class I/II-fold pyridoxal phosphate-dependent enzyme n=1 Tax=Palleronia caenipelagi TaxID=2489174 RepID=A0A547Q0G3_9RHOB|nr:aminotransferase class I/II-fold pyridoxal phosphate-dependent enzyme [Palleronia caenipelagi]TRD19849.1 aminotransferase class I/II-fold pyridoxal phosphate-dependent enzyme [Palleronia caenipelagi]
MQFPERFSALPDYAFPRLRALLDVHEPGGPVVHMSIGEPRHDPPAFVGEVLAGSLASFRQYPKNDGIDALQEAIGAWIDRRYGVRVASDTEILPLNGTREGLFNAALALCPEEVRGQRPVVLIPNPFYQVYAVAALACGAEPVYVPATRDTGFLPDFSGLPAEILDRAAIAYLCSPSNPQGAIATRDYWRDLIGLAERYDFRIFADECYSEIWANAPPPGAFQVAREMAADPERVMIFHSLSKRSNLPGLRSGFVAGGAESLAQCKQLRDYAGAPLPGPIQEVSARVWADEAHVEASLARYHDKFAMVARVFDGIDGCAPPEGGFFLWLPVEDGEAAALRLWRETGVRVLPGAYLSRDVNGENPGAGYIRVALVAAEQELEEGLTRLRDCLFKG